MFDGLIFKFTSKLQGKSNAGSSTQLSPGSSLSSTQSPCSSTTQNQGSASISDLYEPYQSLTSPGSVEVSSDVVMKTNGGNHFQGVERTSKLGSSTELNVSQALRRLEEQLSLNDDSFKEYDPLYGQDEDPNKSEPLEFNGEIPNQDQFANFHGPGHIIHDHCYSGYTGMQGNPDCLHLGFLFFSILLVHIELSKSTCMPCHVWRILTTTFDVIGFNYFFFFYVLSDFYFYFFYSNNCGCKEANAMKSV